LLLLVNHAIAPRYHFLCQVEGALRPMRGAAMIPGLVLLVGCQLLGEALVVLTGLPVPGSVVGMAIVLVAMILRAGRLPQVRQAGNAMLMLVPLLLVPISVGVMEQWDVLKAAWLPLVVALVVSVVLGMAATVWTIRLMRRWDDRSES